MCIEIHYIYKHCGCISRTGHYTCFSATQAQHEWSPLCPRFKRTTQTARLGEKTCLKHVGRVLRVVTPEGLEFEDADADEDDKELEKRMGVLVLGDENGDGERVEGEEGAVADAVAGVVRDLVKGAMEGAFEGESSDESSGSEGEMEEVERGYEADTEATSEVLGRGLLVNGQADEVNVNGQVNQVDDLVNDHANGSANPPANGQINDQANVDLQPRGLRLLRHVGGHINGITDKELPALPSEDEKM
ncbi:uncharacterized protein LY89DRAFT_662950 [Mollisia scopiformis]|uniref:Uncharacterized protein n=1 Tax=Mollisia scopiformis TaxID=149040 RepID=A0A194XVE4_MOLSC|nr:uncharacterized protein LY89DRAFT_662950 [Mollisia scopiformis]KUJ24193.1 hypothetical protein LY89DRAFT_662950 [Mollisia scopiformis]